MALGGGENLKSIPEDPAARDQEVGDGLCTCESDPPRLGGFVECPRVPRQPDADDISPPRQRLADLLEDFLGSGVELGATVREVHEELVPHQRWPEVPGRVTGVLWSVGPQRWGGTLNWMRHIRRDPSRREYNFGFDRSSPFTLYFQSEGPGFNLLKNWGVPLPDRQIARYDAAAFRPTDPNPWGLHRQAHLVDLEVNGGRGGRSRSLHVIVTNARVLDGRRGRFRPHVDEVLVALRRRFEGVFLPDPPDRPVIAASGCRLTTHRG